MKSFIISGALAFFAIGCSCHAGAVKPSVTAKDNTINGEYLVVIDSSKISTAFAKKEIQTAIEKSEVKMISKNIAHIILDPKDDPGLEKIKSLLSKFKWIKSIEQNREAHIS